jgi:hypothetical protein
MYVLLVWRDVTNLSVTGLRYSNVVRIISGFDHDLQATDRERMLAEQIRMSPEFGSQLGAHQACHNRFRTKAQLELEERIKEANEEVERANAQVEALTDESYNFNDTWNEKWDTRHDKFVMAYINKKVAHGELPREDSD